MCAAVRASRCMCPAQNASHHVNPFPTVVVTVTTRKQVQDIVGHTDGSCGPRAPVQSEASRGGVPVLSRGPQASLASLDDPRARWPVAVAVRVVLRGRPRMTRVMPTPPRSARRDQTKCT